MRGDISESLRQPNAEGELRWRRGVSHKTPVSACVSLAEQVPVETRRGFVLS